MDRTASRPLPSPCNVGCFNVYAVCRNPPRFSVRHNHKVADLLFVFVRLCNLSRAIQQGSIFSRGLGGHLCGFGCLRDVRARVCFLPPPSPHDVFVTPVPHHRVSFPCLCHLAAIAQGCRPGDCKSTCVTRPDRSC